eukprot:EG_transcript_21199
MGPLADLRLMFQTLKEWHAETDDQAIMMLTYHGHPDRFAVDSNGTMFFALDNPTGAPMVPVTQRPLCEEGYLENGRPPMLPTGRTPVVLHFNGGMKYKYLAKCQAYFQRRAPFPLDGTLWDVDRQRPVRLADVCATRPHCRGDALSA